jgi:hypothetical protein
MPQRTANAGCKARPGWEKAVIVDARKGIRGVLVNAETGERIPFARWSNLETGEWEAWQATPDGKQVAKPPRLIRGQCKLRFVESYAPPLRQPAAVDAKAAAEQREEYHRKTEARLLVPGDECEAKGCHRLAGWTVAVERRLAPVRLGDGRLQEHGVVVAVHAFCDRHYRSPVSISERGVESQVEVAARPH